MVRGVIPCPLVSACIREESRKGRQTDPQGKRQGWERRAANHAEQRELKPYAFFRQRKRLPGLINESYGLGWIDVLMPCVTSVAVSPIIFPEARPWLPPRSFSEDFPAAQPQRENLPKNRYAMRQADKRAGLPLIIGILHIISISLALCILKKLSLHPRIT